MDEERRSARPLSTAKGLGLAGAAFAIALAVDAGFLRVKFFSGRTYEFCHYGEIGRRLVRGEGLCTRLCLPGSLALYDRLGVRRRGGWPVADRFPVYAYWVACFERVLGESDAAVLAAAATSYALCAALILLLGYAWLGPGPAWLSFALFLLSPRLLYFTEGGYTCFAFALACAGTSLLALRAPAGSARRALLDAAFLGLASAAGWLTRQNFILWTPVFGFLAARRSPKDWKAAAALAYAAAFAAGVAPMLAYDWRRLGALWIPLTSHWNLAHLTLTPRDALPWLQYRVFDPGEVLRSRAGALVGKWLDLLVNGFFKDALSFWRMELAAAFFVAGAFLPLPPRLRAFVRLNLVMLGVQVAAFSFLRHETTGRYYVWFVPAMVLTAGYAILSLPGPRARRAAVAAALAYGFLQMGTDAGTFWVRYRWRGQSYGWAIDPNYPALRRLVGPNETIMTNEPAQVVWYLDRPTVGLPTTVEDARRIVRRHKTPYLYVTKRLVGFREYAAWRAAIARAGGPAEFSRRLGAALVRRFPDGSFLAGWPHSGEAK